MAYRKSGFSKRKSAYAKRSGAARNAKVAQARKVNRPVRRALSRRVRPVTTNTKNNKSAIMTLSKQVRSLQMKQYGDLQWQHQHTGPSDGTATSTAQLYPNYESPVGFCINDLYNASSIWQGAISGGSPVLSLAAKWAKVITDLDVDDKYLWNLKQGHEHVSSGSDGNYMPVSTSIRFLVKHITDTAPTETHTVRFDFFSIKNANTDGTYKVGMPDNLGAYWQMCSDNPVHRNHFNTARHHKLLQTKYVHFYPVDHSRAYTTKYLTMKMNFPIKLLRPEITAGDPAGQTFAANVPTKDQIWCLISTNTGTGRFSINAERWNKWRDDTGVGS